MPQWSIHRKRQHWSTTMWGSAMHPPLSKLRRVTRYWRGAAATLSKVHPPPHRRRLVPQPHIVHKPHLGRSGHPKEATNKRLVTLNDQRCWHSTGSPTETFAVMYGGQHLQKSVSIDIRATFFLLKFTLKFCLVFFLNRFSFLKENLKTKGAPIQCKTKAPKVLGPNSTQSGHVFVAAQGHPHD